MYRGAAPNPAGGDNPPRSPLVGGTGDVEVGEVAIGGQMGSASVRSARGMAVSIQSARASRREAASWLSSAVTNPRWRDGAERVSWRGSTPQSGTSGREAAMTSRKSAAWESLPALLSTTPQKESEGSKAR